MPMNEPFNPSQLAEDEFLAGPDRYEAWDGDGDLLDIDEIFGKSFYRVLREQREYDPGSVDIGEDAVRTESLKAPGYAFVDVPAGLLLLDLDGNPCGGYIGCDLAIEEGHQGQGLGAELVLEYAMRFGPLPTWDLDEAAYTPAGEGAHRRAHALACDREFFAAKREEFLRAMASPGERMALSGGP
jgi:GNAT superfamily N-acetyltransferase